MKKAATARGYSLFGSAAVLCGSACHPRTVTHPKAGLTRTRTFASHAFAGFAFVEFLNTNFRQKNQGEIWDVNVKFYAHHHFWFPVIDFHR